MPASTTASPGGQPKSGFARLAPEVLVSDSEASLACRCGLLGFEVAYARPEERFAYDCFDVQTSDGTVSRLRFDRVQRIWQIDAVYD